MTIDEKITALRGLISVLSAYPATVGILQECLEKLIKEKEGKALFFDRKPKGVHVEF